MVTSFKKIELKGNVDERGTLVALEANKSVPFEIKRVYYIANLNELPRGFHAHRNLYQLAICVSGSCDFILDDGSRRETIRLSKPTEGILIGHMVWREMLNFSKDCVVVTLASEHYDANDYIRDYSEFKRLLNDTPTK